MTLTCENRVHRESYKGFPTSFHWQHAYEHEDALHGTGIITPHVRQVYNRVVITIAL